MDIIVTGLVADEGTVVVFEGDDQTSGVTVVFAVDHRPARDIVTALNSGEQPLAVIESWQVI